MSIHGPRAALAFMLLILASDHARAEWRYLPPGDGDQGVHRAFAFAEESDDRLEFACNEKRRDMFYSAAHTVSERDLAAMKAGEPTILIRFNEGGVVPLDADNAYQKGDRLIFVSAVKPALIRDLGKAQQPIAAGLKADGKIARQGEFPTKGLAEAMTSLAAGCGF